MAEENSSFGTWREEAHGEIYESEAQRQEHMASPLGPG